MRGVAVCHCDNENDVTEIGLALVALACDGLVLFSAVRSDV